jgi:hypothetical protein
MGILQVFRKEGAGRLEAACLKAREPGSVSYGVIKNMLKNRQEESLGFDERLTLLVQAEWDNRKDKKLKRLLQAANRFEPSGPSRRLSKSREREERADFRRGVRCFS